jgi:SNF2 family DNA or RNA helicase
MGFLYPPGAGKTSVMYAIFKILKDKGFVKKMLVVCPIRPMYQTWPKQRGMFAEFEDLKVNVLHGPNREHMLADDSADIYIVNPEGLEWVLGQPQGPRGTPSRLKMLTEKFQVLCVDESTKFKNPQTKRFKLLRHAIPKFRRRYILTGTPTPKGLLDLFGQIYILDEGQSLGQYITHYRNKYFYPSGYGGYDWKPQAGAHERVAEKIAPLVMRVEIDEIGVDLPDLVINDLYVDLPPAARQTYKRMEDDLVARVEAGDIVAASAAVASMKCRQIANGCLRDTSAEEWHTVHDEKYSALGDLLEQLQGAPLLVCYEFEKDRDEIARQFKIPCISTGNARHDAKHIAMFSEGLLPAVMGHPSSIALGIDGLQKHCHHIAMVGVTWDLQNYQQVIMRVQRQGSKSRRVFLHRILARDTVDERVIKVLDSRDSDQQSFMHLLKTLRQ